MADARTYTPLDVAIAAMTHRVRPQAQAVLNLARAENWHVSDVEAALGALVDEVRRLGDRVAQAIADVVHRERADMLRAEDCAAHGETIRHERHQAYWYAEQNRLLNAERVVNVDARRVLGDALDKLDASTAAAVRRYIDDTARAARLARTKIDAVPTLADCQRAGCCEHPPTPPHEPCEQLRLFALDAQG